jgi:hypothetical protein
MLTAVPSEIGGNEPNLSVRIDKHHVDASQATMPACTENSEAIQ